MRGALRDDLHSVYTLVNEWMFPGSPRTGFQRTFELHAGTVRTGEWRRW